MKCMTSQDIFFPGTIVVKETQRISNSFFHTLEGSQTAWCPGVTCRGKDRMMEELMLMGGFTDWKCLHRTFFQQIAELQIRFSFYLCSSILLLFWHMRFVPPFVESDSPSFKFDTNSNGVGVEQENRCHGWQTKLLSIVVYWTPFLSSCSFLFWWNWHYSHLQSVLLEFSLQSPRIVVVYWWTDPLLSYQQLSLDICVQLWGGICIASEGNFSQLESTRHAAVVPSSPFTATPSPHSIVTDLLWGPLSSLCFGLMVVIWGLCKGIIAVICVWLAWHLHT